MEEYNFLNDKYVEANTKMATINGLLMVQSMCARKLMEGHNQGILDIMESITIAIEKIRYD
jgi:hypothetical protein